MVDTSNYIANKVTKHRYWDYMKNNITPAEALLVEDDIDQEWPRYTGNCNPSGESGAEPTSTRRMKRQRLLKTGQVLSRLQLMILDED